MNDGTKSSAAAPQTDQAAAGEAPDMLPISQSTIAANLSSATAFKKVTPAESTAYRFAKLDLKSYGEEAARVVKGDRENGGVYYTNSTHFAYGVPMDPAKKVLEEGRFHPMITAGAITHIWMGEHKPDAAALASFVQKIFRETENAQVAFSPEFTICNDCGRVARGLRNDCEYCGSENVDGITRITGYFTRTSSWNRGKRAELRDRRRNRLA